jgi:hypothetical protein
MSTGYDYTKEPPFGNDADDFTIGNASAPVQSPDEIEKANEFPTVPPGDHVLKLIGFADKPVESVHRCMLNGQLASYRAATVGAIFALPHNERASVRDYFVLPPADPNEMAAYTKGLAINPKTNEPSKNATPGLNASKFYHFIARLGFTYPPGGNLPPEALRLGNWKGRVIQASVEAGEDWIDKEGKTKKGFNRIKFWSYRPANHATLGPQTMGGGGGAGAGSASGGSRGQSQGQRSAQPVGAGIGSEQKAALGFGDI